MKWILGQNPEKALWGRAVVFFCISVLFGNVIVMSQSQVMPELGSRLSAAQVGEFVELALKNLDIEFPNKPSNVMDGPESVRSPKAMHPAFYGCFDWHSSVHGHWMLVRLLKLYPGHDLAQAIREALKVHLTK